METRSQKVFFQKYCFQRTAENIPVPPLWGKRETKFDGVFFVANCLHADKKQLVRRSTLDLNKDSAHGQPARCPPRPSSIDDGLEDIRWIHGLGGENLPGASYGILPNLKKYTMFAIRDGWRIFVFCFAHTSGQLFFSMRLASPPHDTGHCVKTVTLRWVRAPNDRTPLRIHDAVVSFVERCVSRTRNLAASSQTSA